MLVRSGTGASLRLLVGVLIVGLCHAQGGGVSETFAKAFPTFQVRQSGPSPVLGLLSEAQLFSKQSDGASKLDIGGIQVLRIQSQVEWTHQFQGPGSGTKFFSLHVHPSLGSIIEVGGARLGFVEAPSGKTVQLIVDLPTGDHTEWKKLPILVRTGQYRGAQLAVLPPITIRLDPIRGVWDLFVGPRLAKAGMPMLPGMFQNSGVRIRGGSSGIWLMGLLNSSYNPLFKDANVDGVDDDIQTIAAARASVGRPPSREDVITLWQEELRKRPPLPLMARAPSPDKPTGSK